MKKTGKKIFYGWYIVFAGFLCIGLSMGLVNNCFSQFLKPICADMGFTREAMNINLTLISVIPALLSYAWGGIAKHVRLIRLMCLMSIVMPVLYFCYSFAQNIGTFYIISFFMAFPFFLFGNMPFTYIIANWFRKDKGLALGISSMGSGIIGMIMNVLICRFIIMWGWRATYRISALLMAAAVIPSMFIIMKERPSDIGLVPYGSDEEESTEKADLREPEGMTLHEALKKPIFWTVAVCSFAVALPVNVYYQTVTPHLTDCGYAATFAATVSSCCLGMLAVGKIIIGRMFDRFGARLTYCFSTGFLMIGLLSMIFCTFKAALPLIVLGVGFGCCHGAVVLPLTAQSVFGLKDYNALYGKFAFGNMFGCSLAPIITGRVYDTTGSYVLVYAMAAAIDLAVIIVMGLSLPGRKKAVKEI